MPEESLLTDEIRARIGHSTVPTPIRLSRRAVMRAMDVFAGGHSEAPGEGEPAPGFALAALEPETEPVVFPDLLPDNLLISNEWQIERPLVVGEELTAESRIADVTERFGGQFGYSITVRYECLYRDLRATIVARSARTMMQYDARDASETVEH